MKVLLCELVTGFVNSISEYSSIDLDSVETITAQYLKEDKIILDIDSEMRRIYLCRLSK